MLAADATALGVPDTPEDRARYGYPAITGAGSAALPQAHLAAPADCGTHAITRAALGRPPAEMGHALTNDLLAALTRGDLLLADCGSADLELLSAIRAAGADVLWRAGPLPPLPESAALPERTVLPDGSCLCDLRCGPARPRTEVRVLDDPPHRLITTLVDHEAHPAPVLRALYRER
ncbi:hypothetical protein GKQ77_32010 [Streptomyces sp. BG9H]|uniref:Transposase IS4-like domain-containing protein n=1 Tax=Streptomyces anatolicus TaxID=2675858 RepID=A0ABS6Z056_9ACTN|nr:hypothetical protein [Streptomyces anatolicus]MBW5426131.1 hypothetical protein [Streptomyces anatolicus]